MILIVIKTGIKKKKERTENKITRLISHDSKKYAIEYNEARIENDTELVSFEKWQKELLLMAEKERLRLTSDGFGLTSCNSYMNSFIRKQAEEQTEKNIKVIENFDSFIPYNTENKQKLAEAFIRILYASNTAEIINNIKVIISFHQYLRMSKFATNTNTGLSTGLQFFQNTQEGGKTTIVMAHKRAMNELGLTTCLSDLTKISGIYNSENGIQTSHICYYPEET